MTLRKSRGVYYASISGKNGKKRLISTGCTDRESALKVAQESSVEDLEQAAKAGRLTREAIGHITVGRRLTMDKVLEPYSEFMVTTAHSSKTVANNLTTLKCWIREMDLGGLNPCQVTGAHIAKWINNPKNEMKRSSRKVMLSCIRSLFSFMVASGWIVSDVSKLVQVDFAVMSHEQKESPRREPLLSRLSALSAPAPRTPFQGWEHVR